MENNCTNKSKGIKECSSNPQKSTDEFPIHKSKKKKMY